MPNRVHHLLKGRVKMISLRTVLCQQNVPRISVCLAPSKGYICNRLSQLSLATHCNKFGKQYNQRRLPVNCLAPEIVGIEEEIVEDDDELENGEDNRVPVTVITGFLGSGKTTLLNNILTKEHGKRIAIIENEFGEIDIDSELVARQERLEGSGEQLMMLSNGCLCCTMRDDLTQMLKDLYKRRNEFDHILIETTGMANPGPVISTFVVDEDVQNQMRLDGMVAVVDAKNVDRHLNAEKVEGVVNEAVQQIAYADRLILNKTDLVDGDGEFLSQLEDRIRNINTLADIKRTVKADVNVHYVLGIGGYDIENVGDELIDQFEHKHEHHHDHNHEHNHNHEHEHEQEHDHDHDHHHHDHHDDAVKSVSLRIPGDLDMDKVNSWLGAILNYKGDDIFRMKGILSIKGEPVRYVFQGVHQLFEGSPDREWKEGEARESKLVFIGRDLEEDILRDGFYECLDS
eukprot:TRINITY_DN8658_c0_g2_i1.p1 TRINITY_DN8658_c0_g2~~TRINITY_DN8658_c0_g2_i1.p1  ORF type:complete len:458 (-),score=70.39 TRINITY_DN8658_c0_g2_i1:1097-2470(-)